HLAGVRDPEAAPPAVDVHLDRGEDGLLDLGHGRGEELERPAALRLPREDAHERVALGRVRAVGDVESEPSAPLVDRPRPRDRVDDVQAVEPRPPEAALPHVIADQRVAEVARGVAAEVARAAEVAVAGLDVVDPQLPALALRHARSSPRRPSMRAREGASTSGNPGGSTGKTRTGCLLVGAVPGRASLLLPPCRE